MTRITELISILDSEDEPLPKRLKLADCAFRSTALPIHFKEIHLLKWLLQLAKTDDAGILQRVNDWLRSEEIENISKTDVSQEAIFDILKIIATIISSQNSNSEPLIVESLLVIINNRTFQQYFKHDLKLYFKLICQFIQHIKDTNQLLLVLRSDAFLNKLYFMETKSYKYFCKICLPVLGQIMNDSNGSIKKEVIQLVDKCILKKNAKQIENYLETIFEQFDTAEEFTIPKLLINIVHDYYNSRNSSAICLIYSSFCSVFELKFEALYQFSVLLLQTCGLDVKEKFKFIYDYDDCDYDINFSINVISDMYNVLTSVKTSIDEQINGINFSITTQLVLSSLMATSNPSENIMKIFTNAITVEPLILEPMLGAISPYLTFSNINENNEEYITLLTIILNVSAKLYRLPNLIAKLLPSIKKYPSETNLKQDVFNFKGSAEKVSLTDNRSIESLLPGQVLNCFSRHLLELPSWQVINIFKTLIYHLNIVAEDLNESNVEKLNHTYNEMLCTLFCTFLSSVRVTEHTTTDLVVNKFVKCMLDLKNVLQVLGNRLLELNHNQNIMRAYLNICHAWGELSILLNFYSSASGVDSLKSNSNDYQVCCISYIHSYLTAEQWCLITERITNFGEKPCKNVMQSLQLQSIKAIFLFENRQDDIGVLFLRNLTQNPSLEHLLLDKFAVKVLIPNLQSNVILSISKEFIKQVLHEENDQILRCGALECPKLTETIISSVLIKIAHCGKHKEEQIMDMKQLLSTLFLKETEDVANNATTYHNMFKTYFSKQNINESKLEDYLNLLQRLPIMSLSNHIQLIVFLYISALLQHLTLKEIPAKVHVQRIVIGMIQVPSELLSNLQPKFIISFILNDIADYKSAFSFWLDNIQRNSSNFMQKFESLVSYLLKKFESDNKVRICVIHVLNNLNKNKKQKVYVEFKNEINQQRDKIYKSVTKWLSSNQKNTEEVLHFYALSLKHCLTVDKHSEVNHLSDQLMRYTEIAADCSQTNIEGSLLLFSTALTHKKKLEIVNDKFILNIWKMVKALKVGSELKNEYSQLIVLIFEQISTESFKPICEDMHNFVQLSLRTKGKDEFAAVVITINGILRCNFNPIKMKVWQSKVEEMLAKLVDSLAESKNKSFKEEILTFEINLIQANHFLITATMIDEMFRTILILFSGCPNQLNEVFKPCVQILSLLLKYRMPLVTDRLPSFFQQYRILLIHLSKASDTSLNLSTSVIEDLADCAHELEKLTNVIGTCGRHVQRIAAYVVADILQQYENVSMYSTVKIHIDNCVYSLMSLFDQHAISFLMRSLSTASTELFKYMHNNYKRYYRFTGKV